MKNIIIFYINYSFLIKKHLCNLFLQHPFIFILKTHLYNNGKNINRMSDLYNQKEDRLQNC